MNGIRNIVFRSIWYTSLFLVWLVVAFLLLEIGSLLFHVYIEHTNPYIVAVKNGSPLPTQTEFTIENELSGYCPERVGGWVPEQNGLPSNLAMQSLLDKGLFTLTPPNRNATALEKDFANLSDDEKEAYALIVGNFILALDQDYTLQKVYGAYKGLFRGYQRYATLSLMRQTGAWEDICNGLALAEEEEGVQEIHTTFPVVKSSMFPVKAICLPPAPINKKGTRRYVIYEAHPEIIAKALRTLMPEDSLWDIPFYRYKPGIDTPSFSTNAYGLRSDAIALPKPTGVFRVLCVGGSTTEEGSSNETTYPSLLEAGLQQAFPKQTIEVVNAGISGISSDWHLLRLQEYISFEPDLVIIHLGINDLRQQYNFKWFANFLAKHSHFIRQLLMSSANHNVYANDLDSTRFCLELMTSLFQQHGAAVAFASIAYPSPTPISRKELQYYNYQAMSKWELPAFSFDRYRNDIESSNKVLQEISKEFNAFYIPVAESITGTTNIFWDFCHLTQEGIAAKAEILCNFTKTLLNSYFSVN